MTHASTSIGAIVAVVALGASAGCGAKTGLLIDDAGRRACSPGEVVLARRATRLLLVVDRSGSMAKALDGSEPTPVTPSRWELLRNAIDTAFGPLDTEVELGAKFYPQRLGPEVTDVSPAIGCVITPGLEVEPALGRLGAVVDVFRASAPKGGTPTAPAITEGSSYLVAHGRAGLSQAIVLATDGGPNCNADPAFDPRTCTCTSVPVDCSAFPERGIYSCLDERRTVGAVDASARAGVPVYVIGIDDPTRPELSDTLDRLAVAGGRPRTAPGERSFYSVRRPSDLASALDAVRGSIGCAYIPPPGVRTAESIDLRIGGASVGRDPTHVDGWDLVVDGGDVIAFFGSACERSSAPGVAVTVRLACPDAGP